MNERRSTKGERTPGGFFCVFFRFVCYRSLDRCAELDLNLAAPGWMRELDFDDRFLSTPRKNCDLSKLFCSRQTTELSLMRLNLSTLYVPSSKKIFLDITKKLHNCTFIAFISSQLVIIGRDRARERVQVKNSIPWPRYEQKPAGQNLWLIEPSLRFRVNIIIICVTPFWRWWAHNHLVMLGRLFLGAEFRRRKRKTPNKSNVGKFKRRRKLSSHWRDPHKLDSSL